MGTHSHRHDAQPQPWRGSRRRLLSLGAALVGAIALALIASTGAGAKAARGSATPIRFVARSVTQVAPDPSFPQPGDTAVATLNNFRNGHLIGGDSTACVIVDTSANAQCTSTVGLPGGTLEVAFNQNETAARVAGAVTGGTGRYIGARGDFTLRRVGSTSNFDATVHLL
jgi:hypothetical protein